MQGAGFGNENANAEDDIEMSANASSTPGPPVTQDEAHIAGSGGPIAVEMTTTSSGMMDVGKDHSQDAQPAQVQLHTSSHPTDVDPRNLSVMISLSAFIISTGMVCWASISEFVDTYVCS
jgi:hypothetical protein